MFSRSARIVIVLGERGQRCASGVNQRPRRSRQTFIHHSLIDDHLVAHTRDLVQARDVIVAEPYAPMRDRVPELLRLVGAVDAVPVAELEPELTEHLVIVTLNGIDRRVADRSSGYDRLSGLQLARAAVVNV